MDATTVTQNNAAFLVNTTPTTSAMWSPPPTLPGSWYNAAKAALARLR